MVMIDFLKPQDSLKPLDDGKAFGDEGLVRRSSHRNTDESRRTCPLFSDLNLDPLPKWLRTDRQADRQADLQTCMREYIYKSERSNTRYIHNSPSCTLGKQSGMQTDRHAYICDMFQRN